ncbi:hypothetical protein ABNC42_14755 [Paenibacillus larvae]
MLDYLLQFKDSYLSWFGILISIFLAYYAFRYQFSRSHLKDQLHRVYLPMFRLLEPHLYQNVAGKEKEVSEICENFMEIIDKHYELVNPSIIHWTRLIDKELKNKQLDYGRINDLFSYLCQLVDKNFEKTRRKLFYPTRNISYKINNRQYPYIKKLISEELLIKSGQVLMIISVIAVSYTVFIAIKNILS